MYPGLGEACSTQIGFTGNATVSGNKPCAGEYMGWSGAATSCVPNNNTGTDGKCVLQGTVALGDPCRFSFDCLNGWCQRANTNDTRGVCTKIADATNTTCVYSPYELYPYIKRQCSVGSLCGPDNKCHKIVDAGAACVNDGPYTTNGKDKNKVAAGPTCVASCVNKKCQRTKVGGTCAHDTECVTSACYINKATGVGSCITPGKLGDSCQDDKTCHNPLVSDAVGSVCTGPTASKMTCQKAFSAPKGAYALNWDACQLGLILSNQICSDPTTVYCVSDSDCGKWAAEYACNCQTRRCYNTYSGNYTSCASQVTAFAGGKALTTAQYFSAYWTAAIFADPKAVDGLVCCMAPGEGFPMPPPGRCPACSPKSAYACLSKYFAGRPTFTKDMCWQGQQMMNCWRKSNCNKYAAPASKEIKNNCFAPTTKK
eukprot:TRINITY_DN3315_c0_g1_i1.p1 TRINITY_DN3315_c0_g1~~TRINITY_DN3315_c0_g1_i1.p1  ORF type:complete len:501 (+),score=54.74 TRINITY_DN3315_c0_g1_i1:225-1505(+)